MGIEEKGVCVRILEKEYRVSCPDEHAFTMQEAAHLLDNRMRQIRQDGRIVGTERIAIMAALNIAFELMKTKQSSSKAFEMFSERLQLLQEKIDGALAV